MEEISSEQEQYRVPQLIHFVWAGGKKLMDGEDEIKTVAKWCKANLNCQVMLWVDSSSYDCTLEEMGHQYSVLFHELGIPVLTNKREKQIGKPALILQDITSLQDYKDLLTCARNEFSQLLPNFGCSSDIIRLIILFNHGGCYFDQDVTNNPVLSLEESGIFDARQYPLVVLEHRPQRPSPARMPKFVFEDSSVIIKKSTEERPIEDHAKPKLSESPRLPVSSDEDAQTGSRSSGDKEKLSPLESENNPSTSDPTYKEFMKLDFNELGNDAMICTPRNPIILMMLDKICNHYHLHPSQSSRILRECYAGRDRRNISIDRTGPSVNQHVFQANTDLQVEIIPREESDDIILLHCYEEEHFERPIDVALAYNEKVISEEPLARVVEFQPMRSLLRELTCPAANAQNWLKSTVTIVPDGEECRKKILERIRFEIEHFKILRLDDYIEMMISSMRIVGKPLLIEENTKVLLNYIRTLDLTKVVLTQITLEHTETIEFCQKNNLTTLLDLSPTEFIYAIEYTFELSEFIKIFFEVKEIEKRTGLSVVQTAFNMESDRFSQCKAQVDISLSRLESLVKNINLLPIKQQKLLCKYLIKNKDFLLCGESFATSFEGSPIRVEELFNFANEKLGHIRENQKGINKDQSLVDVSQISSKKH